MATPELIQQATRKRKKGLPIALDARYRLHAYAKAGISAATPNEAEIEALPPRVKTIVMEYIRKQK